MATTSPFSDLIAAACPPGRVHPLLEALGFEACHEPVPSLSWEAYGIRADSPVTDVSVAGRAGTMDALLLESRADLDMPGVNRLAAGVHRRNPVRLHLLVFAGPGRLVLGIRGLEQEFRALVLEPGRVRASDLDALEEMAARDGETGLALALRQARALDRSRVTGRFFVDFRAHRSAIAAAFTGLPEATPRERGQLAILFLCRLTFLYFLQRRGTLCGDDRYLVRLFARWDDGGAGSFFRGRLQPLFFGALNRPMEERSPAARSLGALPYLNGGLFEPHLLERRFPDLDLPDHAVAAAFDGLLERYRFTSREWGDGGGYGIDPEILGRVFEGLMAPRERGDTGSFYTPAPVVSRVVRSAVAEYVAGACPGVPASALSGDHDEAVTPAARPQVRKALERVRVLDPACGSGAFLLGALHHLAGVIGTVSGEPPAAVRRRVVARSLHGVDLLDDAALLCSLRLWLALSDGDDEVRPLPNLDRRIRQGDALIDPLDLDGAAPGPDGRPSTPLQHPELRRAYRAVGPAARRYLQSSQAERVAARSELAGAERELAQRWVAWLRRSQDFHVRSLRATASDRDLFGQVPDQARRARSALETARRRTAELDEIARHLDEQGALPFFSFGVHFADTGGAFDLIVSNPPWVRAHRWPDRLRRLAARHYEVCRSPGWPAAAELMGATAGAGAQVDLSLLFLERSCRLLAPGGVLAVLVPAKAMRALYGGGARRMLLRDLEFALIEDHALDHRSIFRADAFTAVLVARRPRESARNGSRPDRATEVRMVRPGVAPLEFQLRARELSLFPDDPASPWLLAPPDAGAALRAMQKAGPPLGRHADLRVRRGIMTGANDVLVMRSVDPGLGGLARVEAAGYAAARGRGSAARVAGRYRAYVETEALRPLVRGADIDAFRYDVERHVVWCHGEDGGPLHPPPRMARYLARHREALEARAGWHGGLPLGSIFRLSADTLAPKVVWHDLSDTLRSVALPARVPLDGRARELIPLNTVYFLPLPDQEDALVMAAILNSLPARTFARTLAERAKDARFRFFAWTLACLPLPMDWRRHLLAAELRAISRRAHAARGIDPADQDRLDRSVGALYGLSAEHMAALARFDRWLRGES
jgi:hypothetical protein